MMRIPSNISLSQYNSNNHSTNAKLWIINRHRNPDSTINGNWYRGLDGHVIDIYISIVYDFLRLKENIQSEPLWQVYSRKERIDDNYYKAVIEDPGGGWAGVRGRMGWWR